MIYDLPTITTSAPPPFIYQQSSQMGNQVIISNAQITRSAANNIGQLINNVAGVQYISGITSEPQILIHAEPALILVNGQPLTNFSQSSPDINLIPLASIEKIIITPGVAGTVYGNQSLGGVINIITKPTTDAVQSMSAVMGTPWMNQITGVSGGPINATTSYQATAQNQYNQGYRANSQQDTGQGSAALQKDYRSGSVLVNLNFMRQLENFPGYLTDVQVAADPTQSIASQGQGDYQANTGSLGIIWQQNLDQNWQMNTNISDRVQNADSNLYGFFTQKYNTFIVNPELDGSLQAGDKTMPTTFGLMFSNETYNFSSPSLYYNIQGATQQQYSTYGSLDVPIVGGFSIAGSGRLLAVETEGQFYNNDTQQFNPESSQSQNLALATIQLNDQLNQNTSVYARRAMGYQLPFIDQSNFTVNPNSGFGLQPTTSTSYETGINWQGTQLQWDAEAFLINLDNEIGFYTPSNGIPANYNLSPTRRQGVTADATYQFNYQWTLGTSLTLMNNYFRQGPDTGDKIPGVSNVLADINVRYQINSIWSIYAESEYTGSQYAQGDNANVTNEIPGYWVENMAINAEISAWTVSIRLNNITNTQYYLATVYSPGMSAPYNNPVAYYPAAGRNGMVSLTYNFN